MKKLIFHGHLAQEFGKEWELDVESPMEALRAVEANTGKLRSFLINKCQENIGFMLKIEDEAILNKQELYCKNPKAKIYHFMPVIQGSEFITWTAIFKAILYAVIAGLIMQMLFKPPKPSEEKGTKSFLFTGAENVAAQGIPVPLGYGRLKVGSRVVSAQMRHYPLPKIDSATESSEGLEFNKWGQIVNLSGPHKDFQVSTEVRSIITPRGAFNLKARLGKTDPGD
tara:strand:- start:1094 stop:1771 length:678 start_codon:yes stop_codon:yes gene_type:complete